MVAALARARSAADVRWPVVVAAVAGAALVVRLAVIAVSGGGADLTVYVYFARLAAAGQNPWDAPAGGAVPPDQAVNLPVEDLVLGWLLRLWDSPDALRVLFALADATTIAVVGMWPGRTRGWRLGVMTFLGFSPFVLYSWTAHAEDKTLLPLGITL